MLIDPFLGLRVLLAFILAGVAAGHGAMTWPPTRMSTAMTVRSMALPCLVGDVVGM